MTISACLVVFNEEKLIERCLKSIHGLVDEIILIHDGDCTDKTLEITKNYTNKIFVRPHIGIAEPHRSFSYQIATGDWILQIDADEYLNKKDFSTIRKFINNQFVAGYNFKWELFDGESSVNFPGLKKLCLFNKRKISYQGIPQQAVQVDGEVLDVDIFLHHQPVYGNISWLTANKKREYWLRSHVKYFFPELVVFQCYNTTPDSWVQYTKKVRSHPLAFLLSYPLKNFFGQLKNGLWKSGVGRRIALQQYVYYLVLFWRIWQMNKKLKLP